MYLNSNVRTKKIFPLIFPQTWFNIYLLVKETFFNNLKNALSTIPGESFGLKFIPNQSEISRIIPEFLSEPNSFIPI